jgi:hypothetical protein
MLTVWLASALLTAALPCAAAGPSSSETPATGRRAAVAELRERFLSPLDLSVDPSQDKLQLEEEDEALSTLRSQVEFLRAGRVDGFDDWPTYADMVVYAANHLGVTPAETALARYRGRVRPAGLPLTADEARARSLLLGKISEPEFAKRYLYIPGVIDSPQPEIAQAPPAPVYVYKKGKGKKKGKKVRVVARGPELAPPPKPISVIDQVDWDITEQLADVADGNAHNWDRRKGEKARTYARRLRRLRKHCYEWVRRDIAALGLWDNELFRGEVPGTRRDPSRPIRAASFALAMAKVESADKLAARTPLRELNLRIDPIVRGAIIVFAQTACGSDRRSGHIEIVTSVVPLRAASYKFHDVRSDCLAKASDQNKIHVYVPLKRETPPAPAKTVKS